MDIDYDNNYSPELLKIPPHNMDAEQSIIGGLLIEPQKFDDVADYVTAEDFFGVVHRELFRVIAGMSAAGKPIDVINVADALPDIEAIGGIGALMDLANSVPTTAKIVSHAKLVSAKAKERAIIAAASNIGEIGFNGSLTVDEKISAAQQAVMAIGESEGERQLYGNDYLKKWVDLLEERHNDQSGGFGISTGMKHLDERLNGWQPSDLVLLAARPAMGKTTLAMQMAATAACDGYGVLVFSLEMPKDQTYNKMISSLAEIDYSRIRSGQLIPDEWPKLSSAVSRLKDKPLYVDDRSGLHVNQILATARRINRKTPLSLIVIDYLQLVRGTGDNRTAEIGSISRALKGLAKDLQCTVLALSQLNRGLETRQNKRPVNADLRDSGELEQDADVILFVYRDEVYSENSDDKGIAEIITGKFRNGTIGVDRLRTRLDVSKFTDVEPGYRPPVQAKPKPKGLDY